MLRSEEFYVQQQVQAAGGLIEIDQSIELITTHINTHFTYTKKDGEVKEFKTKNERLSQWQPDRGEIYELVLGIFTIILDNKSLTYQALVGMIASRFDYEDHLDQVKTGAECIALIGRTGLLTIERTGSGNYIMISSKYGMNNMPECERHEILTEPPPEFTSNYHPDFGSLILGGRQNHHEGNICLDHINRMNRIELKLSRPFLRKYEEAPTFALDTEKKKEQWEHFITNSYRSYIKLVRGGNRFFLVHKDDKRGRCYASGYHINTQGSGFKKAIVQLAQTEIVEM